MARLSYSNKHGIVYSNVNDVMKDVANYFKRLNQKVEGFSRDEMTLLDIGEIYADVVNDFVPQKSGKLVESAYIGTHSRYVTVSYGKGLPYGAYQYNGQRLDGSHVVKNYSTPGTTSHWFDMVVPGTDAWENLFIPQIEGYFESKMEE